MEIKLTTTGFVNNQPFQLDFNAESSIEGELLGSSISELAIYKDEDWIVVEQGDMTQEWIEAIDNVISSKFYDSEEVAQLIDALKESRGEQ